MGNNLEIYFDEGGDFSIGSDPVDLLIVSATAFRNDKNTLDNLSVLEGRLSKIGYSGTIHTAPLVRKAKDYSGLTLKQRREIFWALYNFTRITQAEIATFIFEKQPPLSQDELYSRVDQAMSNLISQHINMQPSIFYDGGQRPLMDILYKHTEAQLSPDSYYADFDHECNRIFQAADLMTYVYRLVYKIKHNLPLSTSDCIFFTNDNLSRLIKDIDPKTTP